MSLICAICVRLEEGEDTPAVAVVGGLSVCRKHIGAAFVKDQMAMAGPVFSEAFRAIVRRSQGLPATGPVDEDEGAPP